MLSPTFSRSEPLCSTISVMVFLMGAPTLVMPSGYSVGPVLLLLTSFVLLFKRSTAVWLPQDWWIIAALGSYGIIVGVMSSLELGARGFDRPLRFLLAIPVLLLIMRFPPRLSWLWSGIAIGAIGAGGLALWMRGVEGISRTGGFLHVIQFGNLSLLMGVLCFAGLGWGVVQRYRYGWLVLLLAGGMLGMLGSFMSGSRGGWVGLPLIGYVLYRGYGRQLPLAVKAIAVGAILALTTTVYLLPQTGVQHRVDAAISDVNRYVSGAETDTSLGLRFEMWRGASQLIMERPLLGWGEAGYREALDELGEQGVISPMAAEFGHAHNEFLDAFAKRGVVGLAVLLMLYMIPIRLFASGLAHSDLHIRSLAVAGTILPVAFIGFGLSQTFLAHNSGVTFYAFWLAVLWGSYSTKIRVLQ